jgi:phage FluMu protein Com
VHCFHCEKRLPKSSPVELQEPYVLVSCPKCGCITTGKVEAA